MIAAVVLAVDEGTRFILPEKSELVWGSIAFGLVVLMLVWKVFPMYRKTLAERTKRIQGQIQEAESVKSSADQMVEEYRQRLANAQQEANRIIEEAKKTADALRRDLTAKAESDAQEIVTRARAEVTSEKDRAMSELRTNVADLTIKVAEKVIGKELSNESAQKAFVDQTIAELSRMGEEPVAVDAIAGYAAAIFEVARSEGSLDQVEDELFRFARTVEHETKLREALQNAAIPAPTRAKIVEELLGKRTSPHTVNLLQFLLQSGKVRQLSQIVDAFVAKAAAEKSRAIAEVRSTIPLNDQQRTQLEQALKSATGRDVELKVLIDPSVLGGLLIRVGDQVFDGTIRSRLQAAREQLSKS